jgi:hypothetical protein
LVVEPVRHLRHAREVEGDAAFGFLRKGHAAAARAAVSLFRVDELRAEIQDGDPLHPGKLPPARRDHVGLRRRRTVRAEIERLAEVHRARIAAAPERDRICVGCRSERNDRRNHDSPTA